MALAYGTPELLRLSVVNRWHLRLRRNSVKGMACGNRVVGGVGWPRQLEGSSLNPLKELAIEKRRQPNRERLAALSANETDVSGMVSVLDEPLEGIDFVRLPAPPEAIAYFHILAGPKVHATS